MDSEVRVQHVSIFLGFACGLMIMAAGAAAMAPAMIWAVLDLRWYDEPDEPPVPYLANVAIRAVGGFVFIAGAAVGFPLFPLVMMAL